MAARPIRRTKGIATAIPPVRKTINSVDLDEDFSDVSGDPGTEFTLADAEGNVIPPSGDATYRYMFADRNDSQFGPSYWKRSIPGWEEVHYDGTVTIKGVTFADGERIESRDLVLLRCNRAKKEKRERFERNQREILNRQRAREAQASVDLSSEDADERAAVVRAHREAGSNLGYQREARG